MFPTKILDSTLAPKITSVLPIYRDNGMLPFGGYFLALPWLRPTDIIVVASYYIAREEASFPMDSCQGLVECLLSALCEFAIGLLVARPPEGFR
jgi:hypothetical protein